MTQDRGEKMRSGLMLLVYVNDEIFVINVGGYIGDSTRSEIEYAI